LDWFNSVVAHHVGEAAASISVEPLGEGEGFYGTLSKIDAKFRSGAGKPTSRARSSPTLFTTLRSATKHLLI
jgi:hypothetical protein